MLILSLKNALIYVTEIQHSTENLARSVLLIQLGVFQTIGLRNVADHLCLTFSF